MKKNLILIGFVFFIFLASSFLVTAKKDCNIEILATNTVGLLNELPAINDELSSCKIKVPYPFSSIISNQRATVYISLLGGNTESIVLDIQGKYVNKISRSGVGDGYSIRTTECVMDTFLKNDYNFGVLSNSYNEGTTQINGTTFFERLLLKLLNPLINNFANKHSNEIEIKCDEDRWAGNTD